MGPPGWQTAATPVREQIQRSSSHQNSFRNGLVQSRGCFRQRSDWPGLHQGKLVLRKQPIRCPLADRIGLQLVSPGKPVLPPGFFERTGLFLRAAGTGCSSVPESVRTSGFSFAICRLRACPEDLLTVYVSGVTVQRQSLLPGPMGQAIDHDLV